MKKSKYNLIVDNNGYHLIFNELNNSCVVLNDECYFHYLNNELDELERVCSTGTVFKGGVERHPAGAKIHKERPTAS